MAWLAGPPSPEKPVWPEPATVVITLVDASIFRTRALVTSRKYKFPAESITKDVPATPISAMVVMMPVAALTFRMRPPLTIYMLPEESTETPSDETLGPWAV